MANIRINLKLIRRLSVVLLVLLCLGGGIVSISLWESNKKEQAMLHQNEVDEDARRRREGWVEYKGELYAPKSDFEKILIIGTDKTEPFAPSNSYNNDSQADFLLLLLVNHKNETLEVLHINRDTMTYVPILGVTGQYAGTIEAQIALAYTYGSGMSDSCENTVDAVSTLLKVVVPDHYIALRMTAVGIINDMVGGVTVEVADDFTGIDDTLIKGENVTLKGEQALNYIRARSGLEDSTNINRMNRQKQFLEGFSNQLKSLGDDFKPSSSDLKKLSDYVISDFELRELEDLFNNISEYEFTQMHDIAGEAKKGTEYVEFYPDDEKLTAQIVELFYEKAG